MICHMSRMQLASRKSGSQLISITSLKLEREKWPRRHPHPHQDSEPQQLQAWPYMLVGEKRHRNRNGGTAGTWDQLVSTSGCPPATWPAPGLSSSIARWRFGIASSTNRRHGRNSSPRARSSSAVGPPMAAPLAHYLDTEALCSPDGRASWALRASVATLEVGVGILLPRDV